MKKIKTSLKSVKTKITDFIINFFKNLTVNIKINIKQLDNLIYDINEYEGNRKININKLLYNIINDFIRDNLSNYMSSKWYENSYYISNGFKIKNNSLFNNEYKLFNEHYIFEKI